MKMRAAVFDAPGQPLAVRTIDVPAPGPHHLLIRVKRCGICGSALHLTDVHSEWNVSAGCVLGHEFSGEVVEAGSAVRDQWSPGERVTALPYIGCGQCAFCMQGESFHCPQVLRLPTGDLVGGYGEYMVIGAREAVRLADHVSWEEGAFTEPLAVGLHAVAMSRIRPGSPVLVLGAGPVGLAAAAMARRLGAGHVAVAARSSHRAELARAMGADSFLVSDDHLGEAFADAAGAAPEIIYECVGTPGMMQRASDLAPIKGEIIMAGACNGYERLFGITPTLKELTYRYAACYTIAEFAYAQRLIATREVNPMPMFDGTVSLDALPTVFEGLRADKTACKLMLAL